MTLPSDDDVLFDDDIDPSPAVAAGQTASPWHVLVVDDDEHLHAVTRMVLKGLAFLGRPVEIIAAHSGRAAIDLLSSPNDIALVLLDVVMETDVAGLATVDYIREKLENRDIRIVLRTGEPGLAPEREVISRYDIDGYEAKSTLTAQKLHTVVIAALRTFHHIRAIQAHRKGLELVIDATASLMQARAIDRFAEGVLTQLEALVGGSASIFCAHFDPSALTTLEACEILACSGAFVGNHGGRLGDLRDAASIIATLETSLREARPVAGVGGVGTVVRTPHGKLALSWVACAEPRDLELRLVGHFGANLSVGLDAVRDLCCSRAQNEALTRALAATLGLDPSTPLTALPDALSAAIPADLVSALRSTLETRPH